MASAINYNTVWTSIFEPVSTFAFLEPVRQGCRRWPSDTTCPTTSSAPTSPASCCAPALASTPGRPATRSSRTACQRRARVARRPQRHDARPRAADLGIRDELRRARRARAGQVQPADAQACPPHVGGGGRARAGQLDRVPPARLAQRRRDEAGRHRARSGARRAASGRTPPRSRSTAARPRSAWCRRRRRPSCAGRWEPSSSSTGGPRTTASGSDDGTQDPREWRRLGARIRELTGGDDPDIVFEHPGRETFGASVFVARRGGTIVTCASTSGFLHEYDNRYLWMNLKRIIGSHFANYREAWEANRLIAKGLVHPTLSKTYPLGETGQAAYEVHRNLHQGKVGVLCLSPKEGLGVRDCEFRERHSTPSIASEARRLGVRLAHDRNDVRFTPMTDQPGSSSGLSFFEDPAGPSRAAPDARDVSDATAAAVARRGADRPARPQFADRAPRWLRQGLPSTRSSSCGRRAVRRRSPGRAPARKEADALRAQLAELAAASSDLSRRHPTYRGSRRARRRDAATGRGAGRRGAGSRRKRVGRGVARRTSSPRQRPCKRRRREGSRRHPHRPAPGDRRAPHRPCSPRPSRSARSPRPRPTTSWRPPSARPTRSGWPRSRRPTR